VGRIAARRGGRPRRERPPSFDEQLVAAGFQGLVGCISEAFGCTPNIDAGSSVQDATFYGQLIIPGRSTDTGADVAVRVSNFGHLAVYALERLRVWAVTELRVL
jgi:hypothetical protein